MKPTQGGPPRAITATTTTANEEEEEEEVQIAAVAFHRSRAWDEARAGRLKRKSEVLTEQQLPQLPQPPFTLPAPRTSTKLTKAMATTKMRDILDRITSGNGGSGGSGASSRCSPVAPSCGHAPQRPLPTLPPFHLQPDPSRSFYPLGSSSRPAPQRPSSPSPLDGSACSSCRARRTRSPWTTLGASVSSSGDGVVAAAALLPAPATAAAAAAAAAVKTPTPTEPTLAIATAIASPLHIPSNASPTTANHRPPAPPSPPAPDHSPRRQRCPPADRTSSRSRRSHAHPRPQERILALRRARFQLEGRLLEMARQDGGPHVAVYDDTAQEFAPQQAPGPEWRPEGKIWISPTRSTAMRSASSGCPRAGSSRAEVEACLALKGGRNVPLHIFHTATAKGWGLRSPIAISKADLVLLFTGEVISSSLATRREEQGKGKYIISLPEDEFVVDAWRRGGPARFLNHSCSPNLAWRVVDISARFCHDYGEDEEAAVLESEGEREGGRDAALEQMRGRHRRLLSSPQTGRGDEYQGRGDTLQPVIAFFSKRAIPAYEELTFDYYHQAQQPHSPSPSRSAALTAPAGLARAKSSSSYTSSSLASQIPPPSDFPFASSIRRRNPARSAAGRCLCGSGNCGRYELCR